MKITSLIFGAAAVMLQTATGSAAWNQNWHSAAATARAEGRPLITMVVRDGCPECARMDASLSNPEADNALRSAVKARVEIMQQPQIASQFRATHTPTLIVTLPAQGGKEVYRTVGAMSVDQIRALGPSLDSHVAKPAPKSKKSAPRKTVKKSNSQ